jgi:undecaprenyl-diphosphatase
VGLALAAGQGWLAGVDRAILGWVAAARDCTSIARAAWLSMLGAAEVSLLTTAAAATVCLLRRRPRLAACLLLLYLSVPIEIALKFLLAQPPPGAFFPFPETCEWYRPALTLRTPHSFPSGYSIRVTYFLVLGAILLLGAGGARARWRPYWRYALAGGVSAVLVILLGSRLVLSWHWPSDIVAGALLGVALAALTWAAARWSETRRQRVPAAARAHPRL